MLTASLASYSGTNPDTADTLAVNMAESGAALATASDLDAQLANTLCIVDAELVSYATATLTAAHQLFADLQRDALIAAGVERSHLYEDQASGKKDDRPGLEACLK